MTTKNIVFIDSRVADFETFIASLGADTEWYLLDASLDGIGQMQSILAGYFSLDAIHVISHGSAGTLYLGSTALTNSNLSEYQNQLQVIGQSLTDSGDILLYGCAVAAGDPGIQLIDNLANMTGADVAASNDASGPTTLNGDSVLEVQSGTIEATALSLEAIATTLAVNAAPTFFRGDGKVTTAIGTSSDSGYSVTLQSDGKILVAGSADNASGNSDFALVRYNTDGSLDTTFDGDGKITTAIGTSYDYGNSVTVQSNGKILVAGSAYNASGNTDFAIVRYNTDGSLDTTFDGDGKVTTAIGTRLDFGQSVTLQSDGKILVAGNAFNGDYSDFALVRYNTDGSLDTTFDGDGMVTTAIGASYDSGLSITIQSDGKILVAGSAYNASGNYDFALVRYNSDGSLDTTFDGDGKLTTAIGSSSAVGHSVTLQSDGKILVAGNAYNGYYSDFALVRYNTDGSLDATFDGDGKLTTAIGTSSDSGYSVTLQSDGKILVAGTTYNASFNGDFALVRYNTDGSLDATFDGDGMVTTAIEASHDVGYSVTIQSDGKILVAGSASNGGSSDFALVRYNTDGSLDLAFHPVFNTLDGAPSYTEDGSAVVLDGNVQIYDPELYALNNYASASLTLVRHGGASGGDQFSGVGIVAGQASGNVTVSSTVIGTYTWTDGSLTIAFNGLSTQSLVNQAMQSLAYSDSSDNPPAAVQIDWTFNDGNTGAQGDGGALSITGSTTVTITAVNDAPTLIAPTPASYIDTAADDTFIAATGTLVGSDVDSTTLTYGISGGTVTSGVSIKAGLYGALSVDTSSGTYAFTPNDAAIEGLKTDATDIFTMSVSDGSLTTTQNYTVNITGANDPTTAITGQTTGTVAEDGTLNATGTLSIGDRDAADTSFVARSVAGTDGYLNIYSNGAWNYFLNNGTAIVQNLVVGQHVTDSFTVTTTGGLTQDVTIQIDGAGNSAPTFTASTGIVTTAVGTSYDVGSSVTLQPDGKILVAGNSDAGFALVRYNSDGSLDASFDGDGIVTTAIGMFNNYGSSVTLQPDGKILVAGSTEISGSGIDFALMRYNTDGSLDTTFSGDGKLNTQIGTNYDYGRSVTLQPDGKILVGGYAYIGDTSSTYSDFALVRYNTDGSLDTTFSGDGKLTTAIGASTDLANSVTLQTDGKILVAGYAYIDGTSSTYSDFALVRYNTDGSLDTTFSGDGKLTTAIGASTDQANSVTVQPDGKILVAGSAYNASGNYDFALVRYNTDGSLDMTFDGDGKVTTQIGTGSGYGQSVTLQSDGKILVAGNSNAGFALVRYNSDGSLDASFDGDGIVTTDIGTSAGAVGESVTIQLDGKIVVAGHAFVGSWRDIALVRYNPDGSVDNTFSPPENTLDNNPTVSEQSTVVLDTNVHILDADLVATGNYSGATLTLSRHAGANTQDVFSATSGGTLSVLTAGAYFSVESVTIGRVTANSTGTLTLTFNANATQTLVDKAMQQIAYTNTSDAPPATAQIDWTFSDGNTGSQGDGGALSTTGSTTVNITPVNDSPRLTSYLADKTVLTGSAFNFTIPQNAFTDPDGEILSYGLAMSDGTGVPPWLTFNAATRTFSGTPDLIDVGSFNIRVTAKDAANASASDVFVLTVHANKLPTGSVSISGMLEQGQILTASNTLADVDGLGEISYQWQASGADISGASGSTYTLTQAEVGKTIALTASYTDGYGTAESVKSTATSAVANVDDEAMGTLGVSGVAQEGGTLTTSLSNVVDADGTTGKAWQWQISDDGSTFWSDITDATAASYAITSDQSQVGKYLRVIATTTDVLGGETTFTGNSSTQIANVDDEASGTLSITGTAEEGGTLTNNLTGASDPDGATTTAYRWQELVSSNWSDLSGAMAATLTIPGDQSFVGKQVRLVATTTDVLGGTTEFIGDANTIANIDDEASGTQSITGTAEEGGTLTASLSNVVDADGTTSTAWQWQISDDVSTFWSNITDTTSVSYAIASDQSQVGKYLRVVATTTDVLGGTTEFIGDANTITNIDDAASGTLAISGKVMEGATISANTSDLSDVDGGIASMAYQWQINTAGGWSDISGATTSSLSLPSDQSYLDSQIRLSALSTDAYGGTTSFTSAAQTVVKVSLGTTIDLMAYSWKAHTLLDGVAISGGAYSGATNASGALSFADVTEPSLALTATRAIPAAEVAATESAVNLQDAIAILKMIVGLDVNGAGKALSPYQALAADFDGSGAVGLTDAIGVLKHVVGLSAPEPAWYFANESDLAVPGINPAVSVALPAINVMLDAASPVHVGLVGYLSGDVDGSYAGLATALDLDAAQPNYFVDLVGAHPELTMAQFGVYA